MLEVVVGIDFGTSGTGYAFSYNNSNDIIIGNFPGQGVDIKVPSEIILDSKLKKVLAFGLQCKKYIQCSNLKKGELYFKAIKMNLYDKNFKIKAFNSSEEYDLIDIIVKILEHVKEVAINQIHNGKSYIKENQIKWVVTVPTIWDYNQRGIMVKACEKAGLFNENTNDINCLALEAEAASLNCSQDKTIDLNYIENGKSFIICDLGGGTGDIVTQKKENNKLIEIYKPIGGNYGSDEIDKLMLERVINKIFGFKDFNELQKKNEEIKDKFETKILLIEWIKFLEEIRDKKKITKDLENETFTLNCQIFENFIENNLQDLVNNYNNSCQENWKISISSKWWLIIPYKIFFDLISEHAKKISKLLKKIVNTVPDIKCILYVGGYSSNEILIDEIKNNFNNITHLKPARPIIAIIKGAVLFGLKPEIVKIRKAPYTIGFNCDLNWDERIHAGKGRKIFNIFHKTYKCLNSFDKFIEVEQDIPEGLKISRNFIALNSRYIYLKFFKTLKKNPILYTEDGVEILGEDKLDLGKEYPLEERSFKVTLIFKGTYVDAKCIHNKSGKEISFKLYFNKNNKYN